MERALVCHTELSKRRWDRRAKTVQEGQNNPGKSDKSLCWVIHLSIWALLHQHQPAAPPGSETLTDLAWVHADISKTIAKLIISLLPIVIIFTKMFLRLTPNESPQHSMFWHFCSRSRWAELDWTAHFGVFFGALGAAGTQPQTGALLWAAEATWLPGSPKRCPGVWATAWWLNKQRDLGNSSKGPPWYSASWFWSKTWQVKLWCWALEICPYWNP